MSVAMFSAAAHANCSRPIIYSVWGRAEVVVAVSPAGRTAVFPALCQVALFSATAHASTGMSQNLSLSLDGLRVIHSWSH